MLVSAPARDTVLTEHHFDTQQSFSGFGISTCGELIQGSIGCEYFLVNCPINLYSHAQVQLCGGQGIHVETHGSYTKLQQGLSLYLQKLKMGDLGLRVTVNTAVPRGKGMASSTSEITAAICAAANAIREPVTPELVGEIVISVDPSDGVYYPGVVRTNPVTGRVYERFGNPPALHCLVVDTGGSLNTEDYDRARAYKISAEFEPMTRHALTLLRKGFAQGCARSIAEAATISARSNQQITYEPMLETLLPEMLELGALGMCRAHTGTVYGILFMPDAALEEKLVQRLETIVGRKHLIGSYRIIGGGI